MIYDNDDLFETYVERRPQCAAVQLTHANATEITQRLRQRGWHVKHVDGKDEHTLEVFSYGGESLFVADVTAGDVITSSPNDWSHLSLIPGADFRGTWEKKG